MEAQSGLLIRVHVHALQSALREDASVLLGGSAPLIWPLAPMVDAASCRCLL